MVFIVLDGKAICRKISMDCRGTYLHLLPERYVRGQSLGVCCVVLDFMSMSILIRHLKMLAHMIQPVYAAYVVPVTAP